MKHTFTEVNLQTWKEAAGSDPCPLSLQHEELDREKLRSLARRFNRNNVCRVWGDLSCLLNLAWEQAWLSIPTLRPDIAQTLCCRDFSPANFRP